MGCGCGKNKISLADQIKKIDERRKLLSEKKDITTQETMELNALNSRKTMMEKADETRKKIIEQRNISRLMQLQRQQKKTQEIKQKDKLLGVTEKRRMTRSERIEARNRRIELRNLNARLKQKRLEEIDSKYIDNLNL